MPTEFGKEPVLDKNPPFLQEMRKDLTHLNRICDSAFAGAADWRGKQSYKKKAEILRKQVKEAEKLVVKQHAEKLEAYEKSMVELKKAEEAFKQATPIASMSISSDQITEESSEKEDVNPIRDIDL